ncbi:type II toxin-antitoxin system RelE/ParE family toxin [Sphingomonas sp. PAMC26645]|uniref:type II toxin-antitoxin system RelE/ParE family toxin n=1 Tax=Sphingomonas sp. PAMC26645 TaxID=2565555 RepID=UPI00109DF9A5|nr:type II toxin-antitoxin system RelE/ParE family toxin [Sphingomonas sp. PAMC26645]QCB41694.1 type II toxin-antitoxin system RelE/ParE family toxin [Sphingomonas sp. PAMC26645]
MQIDWTTPALDDLRGVDDWLTAEADPEWALRILVAIRFRSRFLKNFPRGGRPHRDGYRILRVFNTPYLIRYRLVGNAVQVVRVYHERENWFIEP